jgi:hypothetical protein
MVLSAGTRPGPDEILAPLVAGVWRPRDTRLRLGKRSASP